MLMVFLSLSTWMSSFCIFSSSLATSFSASTIPFSIKWTSQVAPTVVMVHPLGTGSDVNRCTLDGTRRVTVSLGADRQTQTSYRNPRAYAKGFTDSGNRSITAYFLRIFNLLAASTEGRGDVHELLQNGHSFI